MPTLTRRAFATRLAAGAAGATALPRTLHAQVRPAALPTDLAWLTLTEAADLVKARRVSSLELVEACLARIATYNPKLNAFITVAGSNSEVCSPCP